MISPWWLIPSFILGLLAGIFIVCLISAGGDDR